ncbi:hypothetical protein D3Z46_12375 [Bacteroides sartorii]|uniref:Uncharacterized protein n=1 Tax=Phocaeicola sartorii TaxID=671267 RepID=A0A4S2FRE6_9BACT|nr:hypothetical protein [Phocaeicola sartorii]TGY71744.1 hypothetical protein E5339_05440 [Phocaeicola sartorii]
MFLRSVLHGSTRAKVKTSALFSGETMLHSPFPMLQTQPIMGWSIEITSFLLGYIYFFELFLCT